MLSSPAGPDSTRAPEVRLEQDNDAQYVILLQPTRVAMKSLSEMLSLKSIPIDIERCLKQG